MIRFLLFVMFSSCLCWPQQSQDPSQMSLAERAAAARKAHAGSHAEAAAPALTPEQRGSVHGNKYVNDFFQFEVSQPAQWELYSAGRMNVSEAIGNEYLKPQSSGLTGANSRVFGMGDGSGRNIMVSITPLPPDAPREPDQLLAVIKKLSLERLPQAKEEHESVLLGDTHHAFSAFRCSFLIKDVPIVHSIQLIVLRDFVLVFSATGRTDQEVSDALHLLNSNLHFTQSES